MRGDGEGPRSLRRLNWLLTTSSRPFASAAVVGNAKDGSLTVSTTRPEVRSPDSRTSVTRSLLFRTT